LAQGLYYSNFTVKVEAPGIWFNVVIKDVYGKTVSSTWALSIMNKLILSIAALIAALSLAWMAYKGVDVRIRFRNITVENAPAKL
jgi:hypothetical protein